MKEITIKELFGIAINAEDDARELYNELSNMFGAHERANKFFLSLSADESEHITGLEKLRDSLSSDDLERPAQLQAVSRSTAFLNFKLKESLSSIRTLEDAYRAVVNFEFSEINKLNELMFELYCTDSRQKAHISEMLKAHQDRITAFRQSGVDMGIRP